MALARWQGTILDSSGDVVASATVAVYSETTGALATIYSDRAGTTSITNPTTADSDGFVGFYAAGDAYRIVATSGSTSREFRYVGIGTNSENDTELVTISDNTISNATAVILSNLDLYRQVVIEIERLQPLVDATDLQAFVSVNGGASYVGGTLNLYTLDRRTASTAALSGSAGASSLILATNLGTGTGEFYQGTIVLKNHTDTSTYKYVNSTGSVYDATPDFRASDMRGLVLAGGAVTNFAFQMSSGNQNCKLRVKGELL